MRRPFLAAGLAVLSGCGGGAPALDVSRSGTYEFGSTLSCLKTVRSLRTHAVPTLGGEPIRAIAVTDRDEEKLVTVYVTPAAAAARQIGEVRIDDPELDVYGNVVVEWKRVSDEAVDALNRCLR